MCARKLRSTHDISLTLIFNYPLIHLTVLQNAQSGLYLCHCFSAYLQLKSNTNPFEIHGQHVYPCHNILKVLTLPESLQS